MDIPKDVGLISLVLNVVILLVQARTNASIAELKVWTHDNFQRRQKDGR